MVFSSLASAVLLVVLGTFAVGAEKPDMQETRADFERLAAQLPYLSVQAVLFDRPAYHFSAADRNECEEHNRILQEATDGKYPIEALFTLLAHGDPEVRTLAAVALFDREDPSVIPALVELCGDGARTYDDHVMLFATPVDLIGVEPPPVRQTVGDVAKKLVGFYMKRSGFRYGVEHKTEPGFTEYWEARKNRAHCAGWFAVQLVRASQGTSPTPKNRIEHIRAVRKRIDELPGDERSWVLLWLYGDPGSDALVTEDELVEACRELGPGKLLLMLQNEIPGDDPDLQPRRMNNWGWRRMTLFVLRHADQLLGPGDSDELLACERWQRDYQKHGIDDPTITAWWAVGAAHLRPDSASQILHAAMGRFQGKYDADERSTLCVAMWQLCGRSEREFIVDWFYQDTPQLGSFPNCRGSFIKAVSDDPDGRAIILRIIEDDRLADIDWQSLERLLRVVNGWLEEPIVTEEELRKARHPLGQGHYFRMKDEAEKEYPEETAELEAQLSEWRERLRSSVPRWHNHDT